MFHCHKAFPFEKYSSMSPVLESTTRVESLLEPPQNFGLLNMRQETFKELRMKLRYLDFFNNSLVFNEESE